MSQSIVDFPPPWQQKSSSSKGPIHKCTLISLRGCQMGPNKMLFWKRAQMSSWHITRISLSTSLSTTFLALRSVFCRAWWLGDRPVIWRTLSSQGGRRGGVIDSPPLRRQRETLDEWMYNKPFLLKQSFSTRLTCQSIWKAWSSSLR